MTAYVALFRGILAALSCENVRTYIQSGNAVFESSSEPAVLAADITAAVENDFGFAPRVLLMTVDRFESIVAANPYPKAEQTPKLLGLV